MSLKRVCVLFALFSSLNFYVSATTFIEVSLPKNVSIQIPKVYTFLANGDRLLLDTTTQSYLDLSNLDTTRSLFPFAANYFRNNKAVAIVNIRYYSEIDVTQEDIVNFSKDDISELDSYLKEDANVSYATIGAFVEHWYGTKMILQSDLYILRSELIRSSINESGSRYVILYRVISGQDSFTVTVSYDPNLEFHLKPISEKILSSIKVPSQL